jgi:short subunit dehydrogenase-like uncharacterized protein
MAGRIVLFGATGYTGDLTARAMTRRGLRPVLAGRDAGKLDALAGELGGLETLVADVKRPDSVRGLVDRGDVLVSTVGPFAQWGEPAVEAALAAGAHYVDCAGEPQFIRGVFERHGPDAEAAGCGLLTAFGYDWVPGNLAGALALQEAGEAATGVEIGYFAPGNTVTASLSPGTRATFVSISLQPAFAWRAGRLVTVPGSSRWRMFELPSGSAEAISVGSTEHFTLPRLAPWLRDVDTYIGWLGWASRPSQALTLATSLVTAVPGVKEGMLRFAELVARAPGSGPDAEARTRTRSLVVAEARDGSGRLLGEVRLEGANPYELSADMLAWGAEEAAAGRLRGAGALGPVEAFGLAELEAAVAAAGMRRVT